MNKRLVITLLSILFLSAQIGGISGSKLNSVCVDVVDHHHFEFEPQFYFAGSGSKWNTSGDIMNSYSRPDSVDFSSGVQMRLTYGLFDKLEFGVTIPIDASTSSWGMRYVLSQTNELDYALIAGLILPLGNRTIDKKDNLEKNTMQYGLGGVVSYQANDVLSYDFNIQFSSFTESVSSGRNSSIFIDANAGYYIYSGSLQLIAGFSYQSHNYDINDRYLVTFYPGVTIETGENYIIVINTSHDLFGKNSFKTNGFSLALTLTFN